MRICVSSSTCRSDAGNDAGKVVAAVAYCHEQQHVRELLLRPPTDAPAEGAIAVTVEIRYSKVSANLFQNQVEIITVLFYFILLIITFNILVFWLKLQQ
jgi:hypothetical protein